MFGRKYLSDEGLRGRGRVRPAQGSAEDVAVEAAGNAVTLGEVATNESFDSDRMLTQHAS